MRRARTLRIVSRRGRAWTGIIAGLALLTGPGSSLQAQLPVTTLSSVQPPGGKRGSTFELSVGGSNLDELSSLSFSHPGITAVPRTEPPGPFHSQPRIVPDRFVVTVAENVPVGSYELRAVGRFGTSNPRAFDIGWLDEALEKEGNNTLGEAQAIATGTTVNGSIGGGADQDYFSFEAKKGQRLLVDCRAYRLDSRLDATLAIFDPRGVELEESRDDLSRDPFLDLVVPEDGKYTVSIRDALYGGGEEYTYRLSIGTFPHIDFVFPPAALPGSKGTFAVYGRNLPGGRKVEEMVVDGDVLERVDVEIEIPEDRPGTDGVGVDALARLGSRGASVRGVPFRLGGPQGKSNPVLISFATAPVIVEDPAGTEGREAQEISIPCELAGRFDDGRDDVFEFEAKKGQVYLIEVISHRLGLPVDPRLVLERVQRSKDGPVQVQELAVVDDSGDVGGITFHTGSDDPSYRFGIPADGSFRIRVRDIYGTSTPDPRSVYRLSIRQERPDFRLVALPRAQTADKNNPYGIASPLLRRGGTEWVDVLALRRDGFSGPIAIEVRGLPPGVSCPPTTIPAGQHRATLVLLASDAVKDFDGPLEIVGKGRPGDSDVERIAQGSTTIWPGKPNEALFRSRLAKSLTLSIRAGDQAPLLVDAMPDQVHEMCQGGTLSIPVKVTRRGGSAGDVKLSPSALPPDVQAKGITVKKDAGEGQVKLTIKNEAPAGDYAFYLTVESEVQFARNPQAAERAEAYKKEIEAIVAGLKSEQKTRSEEKTGAEKLAAEKAELAKKATGDLERAQKELEAAQASARELSAAAEKARAALAGAPGDAALAAAKTDAEKKSAEAAARAETAAKSLESVTSAAEKPRREAESAQKALAAAAGRVEELAAKTRAAEEEQKRAAKTEEDAKKSAKPKKLKVVLPSTAVRLRITTSPLRLKAIESVATVKASGSTEIPVSFDKLYGFDDAVKLELRVPDSLKSIQADAVSVAKGEAASRLVVKAAADAPPGEHTLNLRAVAKFAGKDRIAEIPIRIRIEAAAVN